MAAIPLSWNDPLFNGVTDPGSTWLQDGGTLSYASVTDMRGDAAVGGSGSFTLDHVRIEAREGVRIAGGGDITISNSYIETTGQGTDHADGIQAYAPGSTGNVTIKNSTIVSHDTAATAGMFIADDYGGTFTFDNVVFQGGPFGLRMNADSQDIYVSLKDVYFVGPFGYDDFLFQQVNAKIHITQWENVRTATIVNGQLVPGDLISPPLPVEGGAPSTPPSAPLDAPVIASFSNDTGKVGDGITSDNTLQLKGTAAANSTVKIYDGANQIGTTTANASGSWEYITSVLTNAQHVLKATATNASGQTSAASALLTVTVDNVAPTVPVVKSDTIVDTNKVLVSGTAEAGSTIKVYDGTNVVGTGTVAANGTWSITTSALSTGSHNLTATATDVAGNVSAASQPVDPVIGGATTPPPTQPSATPKIVSFSNDSGKAGDNITNDNTLTLKGTALANATVKVFDGSTQVGTVKADASGNWSLTTAALKDGAHSFTATASDTTARTSAASTALAVTIDTKAPTAPVLKANSVVDTNHVLLSGTAEAGSAVKVYDGSTLVGTGTAGANGSWSITTSGLSKGTHTLTATATDVAGNVSAASQSVKPVIGTSTSPAPAAPKIASFSNDSGTVGDHITNDSTLTLKGTALANATVKVFDGTTQVGTIKADGSGNWSLTTAALKDGDHSLTATGTDASGKTSAASAALDVKIDTHAPDAPTMGLYSKSGSAVGGTTTLDDLIVKGTAEANSKVAVFDGGKQIGTATAGSNGSWSYDTGHLNDGSHSFTAKAIDVAGNTSGSSAAKGVTVNGETSPLDLTAFWQSWSHGATIKGTADAYSQVKLFDGNKFLGTVKADGDGDWTYRTSYLSDQVHTFKAQATDSSGHTASSGAAILGSTRGNTLTGTTGDDIFIGNGHPDTFVFAANFGKDIIKDFAADGRGHDTLQFSKSVFSDFASVLNHASQVGQDVVISTGDDSLTLKNTKLSALQSHDFHFA
jgi:hypothetical protein